MTALPPPSLHAPPTPASGPPGRIRASAPSIRNTPAPVAAPTIDEVSS